MTPVEYLNAAKIALKAPTNYKLAKELDVPEPRICEYYQGKASPSDETIAKLALALHLPIGEVLADIRSQTAKSEKQREFWTGFLSRIKQGAATALLLIFGACCLNAPPVSGGAERGFDRGRRWR